MKSRGDDKMFLFLDPPDPHFFSALAPLWLRKNWPERRCPSRKARFGHSGDFQDIHVPCDNDILFAGIIEWQQKVALELWKQRLEKRANKSLAGKLNAESKAKQSTPSTGWMPGRECGAGRGRWRSHLRRPLFSRRPAGTLSRLRRGDHLGGWFVRPSIILPRSLVREVKAAVKWMQAPDPWWVVQAKRKREKEDIIAQNPSFDPCFMKV